VTIYDTFGLSTLINATGTVTRLSGGIMRPEVVEAMSAASRHCVDMAELQAAASREIAAVTGAEAGYIASGASACLLLATAACLAGFDLGRMARLPDTRGVRNQVIMVRSQRNLYDHAIRAAGATIVEVGLPDRYAGAGVRDAEIWEIEDAICDDTAAIFYVAGPDAVPPLRAVTAVAARHGIEVIVDAAAQLPPQSNLRRFIDEGASLVAFSGGKVIGGPQASGMLCGKRDLIMSAALQHLDLDVFEDSWTPPPGLIDRRRLTGVPHHGIGRSCKAGKEEIIGLLTALRLFVDEGDAARHDRWMQRLLAIQEPLRLHATMRTWIEGDADTSSVPELVITPVERLVPIDRVIRNLINGSPAIHVDASRRSENALVINPLCLRDDDISVVAKAIGSQF